MKPNEPLPLHHSWPLFDRERRLELGALLDRPISLSSAVFPGTVDEQALAERGIGLWSCDLADDRLTWSSGVYDIFGLPRGAYVRRDEAVALYCEESRAVMERLRAYAIKHRRGFTLDAEIRPVSGPRRWMRLTAAPVCEDGRVVRLNGLKQAV